MCMVRSFHIDFKMGLFTDFLPHMWQNSQSIACTGQELLIRTQLIQSSA